MTSISGLSRWMPVIIAIAILPLVTWLIYLIIKKIFVVELKE